MIDRIIPLRQKDVMIINDIPVKSEIERGDAFSAISNLNMLTAFRKVDIDPYNKESSKSEIPGITYKDIYTTYVDYSYWGDIESNYDFNKEFRKRKDLEHDEESRLYEVVEDEKIFYTKLEHQKDVYISNRLYSCIKFLIDEINACQPKIIITTGKWGLFFLTGCTSLTANLGKPGDLKPFGGLLKFRSSIMQLHECWRVELPLVLIPIYHSITLLSNPEKAYIMQLDLEKICFMYEQIKSIGIEYYIRPDKEYIVANTKEKALAYLEELLSVLNKAPTLVAIDLETFFKSTIDCIGFAYQKNRGCCIPFASKDNSNIWSIEDEIEIICKIREVLLHPNCQHVGQNYQYDCQYFYKLWKLKVNPTHDTMVIHHLLHNKLPKDLAFLASLYCETYTYWKGEIDGTKENPETRWIYNAKDCCYTLEICEVLLDMLKEENNKGVSSLYDFQIDDLHPELIHTMNKGVRINREMKDELYNYFKTLLDQVPEKINALLGFNFNSLSTPQKKKLFKEFFGIELKTNKKKGKGFVETCDAKAMLAYIEEYPLLKPFLMCLLEYSALKKFTSTFLGMKLDEDGRARTQYKITGTSFGRLSSVQNVWGGGGNFQNLPEKGKVPVYYLFQLLENISYEDNSLEDNLEFIENIETTVGADYEE